VIQVLVDGKEFRSAIKDFDRALQLYPGTEGMPYASTGNGLVGLPHRMYVPLPQLLIVIVG
jgi:hypothetical protein